ncbi:MAG TPA: Rne/Rng family ribonuclease [Bryobacteraceae bacterium]|jgi:ribonuclease G
MSKELVISASRRETRVAMVEDDQVVEVYHQRENEYSLAGSIHKGRVTRVLPGMQSAFVDIGLDRDAFLYVSDFFEDNEEYDKVVTSVEEKVLKLDRTPQPAPAVVSPPPAASDSVAMAAPETLVPPPEVVAGDPQSAPAAPASSEQRWDDRRGRRGRRRRGHKGRGLPESKFYSPGGSRPGPHSEPAPPEIPVEPSAVTPVSGTPNEDFFVLPGESLAKYVLPGESLAKYTQSEGGPEETDEADLHEPEFEEPESALAEAAAAAMSPDPQAIEAVALERQAMVVEETSYSSAALIEDFPETLSPTPAPPAETAEALELVAEETAAESEIEPEEAATEPEATGEAEPVLSTEAAGDEPEPAVEAAEGAAAGLSATQREHGPRYPHRLSRRMRRRGRGGAPEGTPRPGHHETGPKVNVETRAAAAPAGRPERPEKPNPSITDLLKEGQEIIVQIAKEPLGQKGARITSHIALPGRFLVYMPTVDHIGVSRKIPSDEERARLKRVLQTNRVGIPGGFIVRTAGDGHTEEELRADMMFLYNLWLDLRQKAERRPAPALLHHDLNVVERVLRDQLTSSFKSIWVDNEEVYESVLQFVQRFQPALVNRVKLYTRSNPIFEEFGITAELEKALRPKVWLKSGGYIVINQTEALVAIDVNTGKFVGKSNRLEDTIVKTNTDAIKEIVRQIRLRDLGGIIVVDFIDMDERKNRQKVMQTLEETMRADRAPYKILQFNDFGLVAITRKRVKQSLERTLCTPCPYCEGAGYVKSPQTVVGEILQEAHKIAKALEGNDVMLRVSPDVAKLLKSNQNSYLQELEEVLGRTVIVKSDPQLHQEKFDLA